MAKISPVSIKYMIYVSFKAEGPLEKPDVIGAIFGQTEGLLGAEMEMRELQKEGKIGRIEVELEIVDGKSIGEIRIPTAIDKSQTTLIAAAIETIDRIGPTEAELKVNKIEDVRGEKRDYILTRAKELLENLEIGNDLSEMSKNLKEDLRVARIQEFGEEKLPAGDLSGNEVIVVEGRADVVNLLRNRINNVIGMNGTKLPAEIAKLGEEKELTLFVDGDRGGMLIAKNVIGNAKIAYVANAPDGKEVEELTGKEILMALRKKIPVSEYLRRQGSVNFENQEKGTFAEKDEGEVKLKLRKIYNEIEGTREAILLDQDLTIIRRIGNKETARTIGFIKKPVYAVILDGIVSSNLINVCEERGVVYLAATNFGNVKETSLKLISL